MIIVLDHSCSRNSALWFKYCFSLAFFTSHLVAKSATPMSVAAAPGSPKIGHMSEEAMLEESQAADGVGGDEPAASQTPAAKEISGSARGSISPPKEVAKAKAKGKAKTDNKQKVTKHK